MQPFPASLGVIDVTNTVGDAQEPPQDPPQRHGRAENPNGKCYRTHHLK
jgi:hypothetical protein